MLITLTFYLVSGCEGPGITDKDDINESLEEEVTLVSRSLQTVDYQKRSQSEKVSPYSCLISTLADDNAEYNYWNQAFWVHFPESVVRQAKGDTVFKAFTFGSEQAGPKAGSWAGQSNIVRVAQCVIPAGERAEELLNKKLQRFGKGSWLESRRSGARDSKSNDDSPTTSDWKCTEWYVIYFCKYDSDNNVYYDCVQSEPICASWVYEEGDSGGGGGGGDGFPSDDPGDCDPTMPCFDDGDGGSPPPPPDPCTENDPPVWCDDPCETGDSVIDNTGIQETFEDIWEKSETDKSIEQRKEQGGYIVEESNGELGFIAFPDEWPRDACGIDPPSNFLNSVPTNLKAVAHSHPFFEDDDTTDPDVCGEGGEENYESMHSGADLNALIAIANHLEDHSIKGYVIDGSNIVTYNTQSFTGAVDIDSRCGY